MPHRSATSISSRFAESIKIFIRCSLFFDDLYCICQTSRQQVGSITIIFIIWSFNQNCRATSGLSSKRITFCISYDIGSRKVNLPLFGSRKKHTRLWLFTPTLLVSAMPADKNVIKPKRASLAHDLIERLLGHVAVADIGLICDNNRQKPQPAYGLNHIRHFRKNFKLVY